MSLPFGYIGSNNGENGFAFRSVAGSPSDSHPFTSTLGALLRLCYGIREWSLNTDLVLHAPTGDFNLPNSVIPAVAGSPSDKYGLLIGSTVASAAQCSWDKQNTSGHHSGLTWSLFQLAGGDPGRLVRSGGAYYPYLDVLAFIDDEIFNTDVRILSNPIVFGGTPTVNGKLKLGGGFPDIEFPLYYILDGSPTPPTFTMTKFELSPSALW